MPAPRRPAAKASCARSALDSRGSMPPAALAAPRHTTRLCALLQLQRLPYLSVLAQHAGHHRHQLLPPVVEIVCWSKGERQGQACDSVFRGDWDRLAARRCAAWPAAAASCKAYEALEVARQAQPGSDAVLEAEEQVAKLRVGTKETTGGKGRGSAAAALLWHRERALRPVPLAHSVRRCRTS